MNTYSDLIQKESLHMTNRPIEFNVWDKINKVMTLNAHTFDTFNEKIARPNEYDVLQYIDRKDMNGDKIFDGHVIRSDHFKDTSGIQHYLHHVASWSDKFSGWVFLSLPSLDINNGSPQAFVYFRNAVNCLIVGNVYEDKVLLK